MADGTFGRAWRGTFERLAAPADCLPAGFDALKRRPAAASKPLRDVGKRLRGLQGGHDRPFSALAEADCSLQWRPLHVALPELGGEVLFADDDMRVHRSAAGDALVATRYVAAVGGPPPAPKAPLTFAPFFA